MLKWFSKKLPLGGGHRSRHSSGSDASSPPSSPATTSTSTAAVVGQPTTTDDSAVLLGKTLKVRNLSLETKAVDLRALFAQFGKVSNCRIYENDTKQLAYAIITMGDEEAADLCIEQLNHRVLDERKIEVVKVQLKDIEKNIRNTIKMVPSALLPPPPAAPAPIGPSTTPIDDSQEESEPEIAIPIPVQIPIPVHLPGTEVAPHHQLLLMGEAEMSPLPLNDSDIDGSGGEPQWEDAKSKEESSEAMDGSGGETQWEDANSQEVDETKNETPQPPMQQEEDQEVKEMLQHVQPIKEQEPLEEQELQPVKVTPSPPTQHPDELQPVKIVPPPPKQRVRIYPAPSPIQHVEEKKLGVESIPWKKRVFTPEVSHVERTEPVKVTPPPPTQRVIIHPSSIKPVVVEETVEAPIVAPSPAKEPAVEESQPQPQPSPSPPKERIPIPETLVIEGVILRPVKANDEHVLIYSPNISWPQILMKRDSFSDQPKVGDWFRVKIYNPEHPDTIDTEDEDDGRVLLEAIWEPELLSVNEEKPFPTRVKDNHRVELLLPVVVGQKSIPYGFRHCYTPYLPSPLLDINNVLSDVSVGRSIDVWCTQRNFPHPINGSSWKVVETGKKNVEEKLIIDLDGDDSPACCAMMVKELSELIKAAVINKPVKVKKPKKVLVEAVEEATKTTPSLMQGVICSTLTSSKQQMLVCSASLQEAAVLPLIADMEPEELIGQWIEFTCDQQHGSMTVSGFSLIESPSPALKIMVTNAYVLMGVPIDITYAGSTASIKSDFINPIVDPHGYASTLQASGGGAGDHKLIGTVGCQRETPVGEKLEWALLHIKKQ